MPLEGLEPTTFGLQNQRSTIKLKRYKASRGWESNPHYQCQKLTFYLLNYLYTNGADGI